jgi:hypothetical protein
MALTKLTIAPDQAGYAVTDGVEVISAKLDGGASRYRKDVVGANSTVNAVWRVGKTDFRYLRSFFNILNGKGAKAFLLDLYLDREELTEHECHFIPGSFRLSGQRGQQFTVSAQIEAKPIKLSEEEEEAERVWATLYGELGPDFENLFPPIESDFDDIITIDFPANLEI